MVNLWDFGQTGVNRNGCKKEGKIMINTYSKIDSSEFSVNIDISVGGFGNDDKIIKSYIQEKAQDLSSDIYNFLWNHKNKDRHEVNLKNFMAILGDCYIKAPNEYYKGDHCEPWYIFYTKKGPLKVGWRKRVINVDWSGFPQKEYCDKLFPNENVTKGDFYIHAWGYQDLKKFVGVLLNES